jgi:single-strand DNA-binding protein
MATIFETRLIGNIGRDAVVKIMDRGIIAINFPVAHNKNWKDKRTGEQRTKTTWINCTIWKREGANVRIVDFLKKGTLVELTGTPFAKTYSDEDGQFHAEIRLNVAKTNILKVSSNLNLDPGINPEEIEENFENFEGNVGDFSIDADDF